MCPLILNIDDHEPGRYARSQVLRAAGLHVIEAATGQQGLDLARSRVPALVILDIRLPDLSGIGIAAC